MATNQAQGKWRSRNRYTKKQLNVMARVETHAALEVIADHLALNGKAEAVTFAVFVVRWMMQQGETDPAAAERLARLADIYHQNREVHAP